MSSSRIRWDRRRGLPSPDLSPGEQGGGWNEAFVKHALGPVGGTSAVAVAPSTSRPSCGDRITGQISEMRLFLIVLFAGMAAAIMTAALPHLCDRVSPTACCCSSPAYGIAATTSKKQWIPSTPLARNRPPLFGGALSTNYFQAVFPAGQVFAALPLAAISAAAIGVALERALPAISTPSTILDQVLFDHRPSPSPVGVRRSVPTPWDIVADLRQAASGARGASSSSSASASAVTGPMIIKRSAARSRWRYN